MRFGMCTDIATATRDRVEYPLLEKIKASKCPAVLAINKIDTVEPDQLLPVIAAYSRFFDKYRKSVVSEVSGAVNDTYLKLQGQTAGTKSYGLVVDLAVAYHLRTEGMFYEE